MSSNSTQIPSGSTSGPYMMTPGGIAGGVPGGMPQQSPSGQPQYYYPPPPQQGYYQDPNMYQQQQPTQYMAPPPHGQMYPPPHQPSQHQQHQGPPGQQYQQYPMYPPPPAHHMHPSPYGPPPPMGYYGAPYPPVPAPRSSQYPPPHQASHYDDYRSSSSSSSSNKRPRSDNNRPSSSASSRDRDMQQQGSDLPSRTLFVRNVAFDVTEDQVRTLFSKYGEIKTLFNMLERRGLVFVTYFDIRAADRARKELNNTKLGGRSIDVYYSVPKNEDMRSRSCDAEKNQGTILLTLKDGRTKLDNDDLSRMFRQYGDLKVVRDFKGHPNQRFIEFYDSRHCAAAVRACTGMAYNGGHLDCRHAWDAPHKYRSGEAVPKHEYRSDLPYGPSITTSSSKRSRDSDSGPSSRSGPTPPAPVNQQSWGAPPSSFPPPNHPYHPVNPMAAEAQQAQQMLTALTQSIQMPPSAIPQSDQFSVVPNLTSSSVAPSSYDIPPSSSSNTSSNDTTSVIPGTEALAQMNQLLQLLQQTPVVSPTDEPETSLWTPSDPRQRVLLADGIGVIDTIPNPVEVENEFPKSINVFATESAASAENANHAETEVPAESDAVKEVTESPVADPETSTLPEVQTAEDSVEQESPNKKQKSPARKSIGKRRKATKTASDNEAEDKPVVDDGNNDTEKQSNGENEGDHSDIVSSDKPAESLVETAIAE